jgi:hypothetical protein
MPSAIRRERRARRVSKRQCRSLRVRYARRYNQGDSMLHGSFDASSSRTALGETLEDGMRRKRTTRRISTLAQHIHTQTRHAQRAQQAGVHFPQGLFRRLMVFNCQAGLYTIAFKSNTLIFDDTRQAQSDKDPQATIPKSTFFFYLYNILVSNSVQ